MKAKRADSAANGRKLSSKGLIEHLTSIIPVTKRNNKPPTKNMKKKKTFQKFDDAKLGDTVTLQLRVAYSSTQVETLNINDRNLLNTSVKVVLQKKTLQSAILLVDTTTDLHIELNPLQYQKFVNVSEHYLNSNRDFERLKSAINLLRRCPLVVGRDSKSSSSSSSSGSLSTQSSRRSQHNTMIVSLSQCETASDNSGSDSEYESGASSAQVTRRRLEVVPTVATYGANGETVLMSDRACKYSAVKGSVSKHKDVAVDSSSSSSSSSGGDDKWGGPKSPPDRAEAAGKRNKKRTESRQSASAPRDADQSRVKRTAGVASPDAMSVASSLSGGSDRGWCARKNAHGRGSTRNPFTKRRDSAAVSQSSDSLSEEVEEEEEVECSMDESFIDYNYKYR